MRKVDLQKWIILVIVLVVLIPFSGAFSQSERADVDNQIYLPLVMNNYPPVVLTDMWVGNADGYERSAFRPGDAVRYITVGENHLDTQTSVDLQWDQIGPCGATQIFTGTLSLEPGLWVQALTESAPDCLGTYTNTVQLTHDDLTSTLMTTFDVVTYTTEIVISEKQGFDKCGLPSIGDMHTWWLESPYWVFNIYLGGSSFACDNPQLDADWVWDVSQQGWQYILTWVGPQSPCFDTSKPKINMDPAIAFAQGQDEADLAIASADNLGLTGDRIIYYDIEGYTDTDDGTCSEAVDSFLTGWTARLHELGLKAGAYGSPCRSFMLDWWNNEPLLDDIWIARWIHPPQYDPDVTVWGEICGLTDAMWANQQRLRQYAGDHPETWGDITLGSIDSNVLLGEITAISTTTNTFAAHSTLVDHNLADACVRDAELLTPSAGWVLKGEQLLITHDGGKQWDEITPADIDTILDVDFLDSRHGWLVSPNSQGEFFIYQTVDGGLSWQAYALPASAMDVSTAYLEFIDGQTGWVVLKMVSGSSFSMGKLFSTQDGGYSWEERSIPLGEPVQFSDQLQGWVAGGPADDQYYSTTNGGNTWRKSTERAYTLATGLIEIPNLPENMVQANATDQSHAWALTQNGSCWGDKSSIGADAPPDAEPFRCATQAQLWMTSDGGQTWLEITPD